MTTPDQPGRPASPPLSRAMVARTVPKVMAWLLILLGSVVATGWLLRLPVLVQLFPGLTAMVMVTAIGFLLLGLALLLPARTADGGWWVLLPAALAAVLPTLNLLQLATGADLGINLTVLHDWIDGGNRKPGEQAFSTSISFLLAALSLLALTGCPTRSSRLVRAGRGSAALLFVIAFGAVAGYALRLEVLLNWYLFAKMALNTAIGIGLLSVGLWWRWDALEDRRGGEERDLYRLVSVSLVMVALLAAVTAISVFRHEGERALDHSQRQARDGIAEGLRLELDQHRQRAGSLARHPALIAAIERQLAVPDDPRAVGEVQKLLDHGLGSGYSRIEIRGDRDQLLAEAGVAALPQAAILPLADPGGDAARLLTGGEFVLQQRQRIEAVDGRRLLLVTEQSLPGLARLLEGPRDDGPAMRRVLCLADPAAALCVDARGRVLPAPSEVSGDAEEPGMGWSRAPAHHWQAVGDTGLVLWLQFERAELYAPVRRGLFWGFVLVAVVTAFGVVLVDSRIRPLARQLAQAEGHYQTVLETVDEGLMLIDASGRILTINRAAAEILDVDTRKVCGYLASEVDWIILHEDGRPCPAADYPATRTLATGERVSNVVLAVDRRDGERRWISVNASPAAVASASETDSGGVVVSFSDLTEQRAAEAASKRFEAEYKALIGGIADGVVSIDEHGIVYSFNQAAERIFGYAASEVIGLNVTMLMPERFRANHDRNVERFALQQDSRIIGMRREVTGQRADGREFPMMLALNVSPSEDPKRFVALVTDISERKRVERQLLEAGRLREAIVRNAPFLVISTDVDGVITAYNPAAERLLWYRAEEMTGNSINQIWDRQEMSRRAAELAAQIGRAVQPGFETFVYRARHQMSEEHELMLVRKDGSQLLANMAITALYDGDGVINGFLAVGYDITERKRRESHTQHIASHDFLTGLPNRMLLHDRLTVAIETAQRNREKLAVVVLDLDHFKRVNDSLGHLLGDQLLVEVARRLQYAVRASDTVARMGGDEFVLLLPKAGNDEALIDSLASKIIKAVSAPLNIEGHELHVSTSLGIARFPDDGERPEVLLKHADVALYRAKAAGRGCYRLFSEDMAQAADERLRLEAAVRRGLSDGGFQLLYQPQLDLDSGEIIGMEALLRLDDAVLGRLEPDRFLTVAEESGLMTAIGEWVLIRALTDVAAIEQRSGMRLRVLVNLSPRQFAAADLVTDIGSLLERHGLSADRLGLEIGEGGLMHDTDENHRRLQALQQLGVSVAIDNFGRSFSGLCYLTRAELDTVKIDRGLIAALPDSASDLAVVRAVIALATSLDIRLVAEGVENAAQLDCLRQLHSTHPSSAGFAIQGFHHWPALTLDALAALCQLPPERRTEFGVSLGDEADAPEARYSSDRT